MIYIIKHKQYHNIVPNDYKELYVGDLFQFANLDNINELNLYINEATGIYHIWKHCEDDIVGLCHYRRFFWYKDNILKLEDAEEILKDNDIIITKNVIFQRGIYEQLRIEMNNDNEKQILDKYYRELCEKEPELRVYFCEKEFAPKEMFVCKKELLNKYCEWLFPLIIPITKEFIEKDIYIQQKRMIGHLIERLFYYWIKKNNLEVYRMEYVDV